MKFADETVGILTKANSNHRSAHGNCIANFLVRPTTIVKICCKQSHKRVLNFFLPLFRWLNIFVGNKACCTKGIERLFEHRDFFFYFGLVAEEHPESSLLPDSILSVCGDVS